MSAKLRRLFVPSVRIDGARARLGPADLHYLERVLRLEEGTELEVLDGEGGLYRARLRSGSGEPFLELGPREELPETGAPVHLAFALARGERCDLVVQKATELGVTRFLPFEAARSVVRLDEARGAARARRWQRIAAEAARQCGRAVVPDVALPRALPDVLRGSAPELVKVLFYEGGGESLASIVEPRAAGHLLIIGPEGGFEREEVELCLASGARLATLGTRVLRVETAGIVAVALVRHQLGELG